MFWCWDVIINTQLQVYCRQILNLGRTSSKKSFSWTRKFASCRSFLIDCSKNPPGWGMVVVARDTREGWPLLTVETEANGDSTSTYERGPFLVGSLGWLCQYKRFLSCLGCSSRPSTKYFFLIVHCFTSFFHLVQQAGQASVPRCLSLNMCLW